MTSGVTLTPIILGINLKTWNNSCDILKFYTDICDLEAKKFNWRRIIGQMRSPDAAAVNDRRPTFGRSPRGLLSANQPLPSNVPAPGTLYLFRY